MPSLSKYAVCYIICRTTVIDKDADEWYNAYDNDYEVILMKVFKNSVFALLYLALFFSGQVLVTVVYTFCLTITGIGYDEVLNTVMNNSSLIAIIGNFLAVAVAVLIFVIRKKRVSMEIGLHQTDPMFVILAAFIGFGGTVVVSFLMNIIPFTDSMWETYNEGMDQITQDYGIVAVIATVIVAPLVEEFFFRGLIFSRLARGMNIYIAAVVSALMFGVAHGNFIQGTYAFLLGLLLCFVYVKSRSLWGAIAVHMGFNSFSFVMDLISDESAQYGIMTGALLMFMTATLLFIIYPGNFPRVKTEVAIDPLEFEPTESVAGRKPDEMNLYISSCNNTAPIPTKDIVPTENDIPDEEAEPDGQKTEEKEQ